MPNMPKKTGDAVLSRDGTVKVNGAVVGVWRLGVWEDVMKMYYFSLSKEEDFVVKDLFKDAFKQKIPEYLENMNRLPPKA